MTAFDEPLWAGLMADIIEHEKNEKLGREEAAARLRALADQLGRHNEVTFVKGGKDVTVRVPDQVEFSLEVEVGDDESEIEIEISW